MNDKKVKKPMGFAAMDRARLLAICAQGGRAVKAQNRSFSVSRELAARAGTKGGSALAPERRSFSLDRALASEAGRKGGKTISAGERSFAADRKLASEAGRKGGVASQKKRAEQQNKTEEPQ
jgi:general stress protein YciG